MRFLLLFISLLSFQLNAQAQTNWAEVLKQTDQYIPKQKFDKAIELLKPIEKEGVKDSLSYEAFQLLAKSYFFSKKREEAQNSCKHILKAAYTKKHPKQNIRTLLLSGDIYKKVRMYQEAQKQYQAAVDICKKNPMLPSELTVESYNMLGYILYNQGEYKQSAIVYQEIIKSSNNLNILQIAELKSSLANSQMFIDQYGAAVKNALDAYNIYINKYQINHPTVANTALLVGDIYNEVSKYDSAKYYTQIAIDIYTKINGKNHRSTASALNNLAGIYNTEGDFNAALKTHNKALKIRMQLLGTKHPNVAASYNNIGITYAYMGENTKAYNYMKKCRDIYVSIVGTNHPAIALLDANIGLLLIDKKNAKEAFPYLRGSYEFNLKNRGEKHSATAKSASTYGLAYLHLNKLDSALILTKKGYETGVALFGPKHQKLSFTSYNLAQVYQKRKEYDLARKYHLISAEILHEYFGKRHPDLPRPYQALADMYYESQQYDSALIYYQKGLNSNNLDEQKTDTKEFPAASKYMDYAMYFEGLVGKARCFYQQKDYNSALEHIKGADKVLGQARKQFALKSDKLSLASKSTELSHLSMDIYLAMKEDKTNNTSLDGALYYVERSNGAVLQSSLADRKALKNSEIPEEYLTREKKLRIDMAQQQNIIKAYPSEKAVKEAEHRLFELERQQDLLVKEFEDKFPAYYQLKYQSRPIELEQLQDKLQKDQAYICWQYSEEHLYMIYITQIDFQIKKVAQSGLDKKVTQLRNSIKFNRSKPFNFIAHQLYKDLFPISIDKQIKHLILVPSGQLTSIPFEALHYKTHNKGNKYEKHPFLVKKYKISYTYSASLFANEKNDAWQANAHKLFALAPVFDGNYSPETGVYSNSYFEELPSTQKELLHLQSIFSAQSYIKLKQEATESELQSSNVQDYAYVHIATHGMLNSEEPDESALILYPDSTRNSDGTLYSGELYNLHLKAHLVTLSACETGLGKVLHGEGVIGLVRSFLYAGAQNVVVSLWKVSDKGTSELMIKFYRNLESKASNERQIAEALRDAKLQMIKSKQYAAPYYWGAFIQVGNE